MERTTTLAAARERYTEGRRQVQAAVRELADARVELGALEEQHLAAAGATGDLDVCLRALTEVEVTSSASSPTASQVVTDYLRAHIPDDVCAHWDRANFDGHEVVVPSLDKLGPTVPAGAADALRNVVERFSQVFTYPDDVALDVATDDMDATLTLTRSTGHASLVPFDNFRHNTPAIATGPLLDVLRWSAQPGS